MPVYRPWPGERARRTDAYKANRVHFFRCRNCSRNSLEVDPGHTLARLVRAPDSHSSDRGEGKGDQRCRLASSLTDRGRRYAIEIRIRGGGRQSAYAVEKLDVFLGIGCLYVRRRGVA